MSAYRKVFEKRHTLIPVVHVETREQALRNVVIAKDNLADGVFLINHSIASAELLQIYAHVRNMFPGFWVGLNMLDLSTVDAFKRVPMNASGLWTDDAGITERSVGHHVVDINAYRTRHTSWGGLYFGGIAFKGQRTIRDPGNAAESARSLVDVVTTSGLRTGLAPEVKKIRTMKRAIGDFPLAIASGITFDNVADYMEWCDCFLVATGISDSHTELNPTLVRRLAYRLAP